MDSFNPYELYSQYSPMGRNMGNPVLNMLMMSMFGRNNYMPSLDRGESIYDSFLMKERSNQFMHLQGSSFANNMLFKRLGVQNNPMAHMMGAMAASPDSMIGKALFPMIGGNPMAASMQTYAKLSGANTMGNFGRIKAITSDETERVMQGLAENFYKTQKYEGPEGGREDIRKQAREFLTERLDKKDYKYLEDVGFKVEKDSAGKYTSNGLAEQIANFDPTAGKSQEQMIKESRQRTAANLSSQIAKIMGTSDENTSKALLERLEKQVTAFNVMTKEQFKQTLNSSGLQGIRSLVQQFEKRGGVEDSSQAAEARKNISSEFGVYLNRLTSAPTKSKKQVSQDIETGLVAGGYATPAMIERIRGRDGIINADDAAALVKSGKKFDAGIDAKLMEDIDKQLATLSKLEPKRKTEAERKAIKTKTAQFNDESLYAANPGALEEKLVSSGVAAPEQIQKVKAKYGSLTKQATEELVKDFETRALSKLEPKRNTEAERKAIKTKTAQFNDESLYAVNPANPGALEEKLVSSGVAAPEQIQKVKAKYGSLTKQATEELVKDFETRAFRKLDDIDEKAKKTPQKTRTRQEVSEELIKNIHRKTYSTEQEVREAITDQQGIVEEGKALKFLKQETKRKAAIGDQLRNEAENIASPSILQRFTEIFGSRPSKKESADILGKKLVSEKIITQEELASIKDQDGNFDQRKTQDFLAKRKKELADKISTVKKSLGTTDTEELLVSSGIASKEEIQKRRVKFGALTNEAATELINRYEDREKGFIDRLSSDTTKTLFDSKRANKKERTEAFLNKLQERGIISENERGIYVDKNGELDKSAVEQLISDKLGKKTEKQLTAEEKDLQKKLGDPTKASSVINKLEKLTAEPLSGASRTEGLIEKLKKAGVLGEDEDASKYVDKNGRVVKKEVYKALDRQKKQNEEALDSVKGTGVLQYIKNLFKEDTEDVVEAKKIHDKRETELERLRTETKAVDASPKIGQLERTTEILNKLVESKVISMDERAEYLDEKGKAKKGSTKKLASKLKRKLANLPTELESELQELDDLQVAPTTTPETYQHAISESIKEKLIKNNLAGEAEINTLIDENGNLNVQRTKEYLNSVKTRKTETQQQLDKNIETLKEAPSGLSKKEVQEQIRKKAIDSGIITVKQWEGMLNESGELDVAKFNEHRTKFEKVGIVVETDESREARNLSTRALMRKNIASEVLSDLTQVNAEKNTDTKKTLHEQLVNKLKNTALFPESKIASMLDQKTGFLDESKLRTAMEDFSEMDKLEYLNAKSRKLQEAGKSFLGFNFENSRGFKLEDFHSALGKGAELRMFGDNRGMSPEDVMQGFSKYGAGTLSAARAVFGEGKSGSEYMQKISNLVGGLDTNLASVEGNEKMEGLLRDVEATARVAGVSIKTMLSIIESAQDLAAEHPELATMSKSAITKLSLNAVQRATDLGRSMSAEEYRQSGGSQKMAAEEIKESMAFAQSPLGGSLSALLLRAKEDPKTFEWFSEQVKQGKATGRGLDNGLFAELANRLKVSASDLAFSASNPLLAEEGMRYGDISELLSGEGGKEIILNSFLGGDLYNVRKQKGETFEDFKKRIFKEHKEFIDKGGTEQEYMNQKILPNLTEEGSKMFKEFRQTIRGGFIDSMRSDDAKAEMANLIKQQKQATIELDKQYSAQRSPVVTQLMDAILQKNKVSTDVIIDATTAAFATKGDMSDQRKKATEEAKKSLENMGKSSRKTDRELIGTDEAPGEGLEALNKMVGLRKQLASEAGEKGNQDEAALANKLEGLTAEELRTTAQKAKHLTGTLNENKELLANLEAKEKEAGAGGEPLTKNEQETLSALKNLRKIGAMEDESKFTTAQKGGVGALVAAATESVFSANDKERVEHIKKNRLEQLQLDLENQNKEEMKAGGGLTTGMLEYYKDKGGVAQAAEDYKNRKGMFENEETREAYAKSKTGHLLAFTNEQIATDEEQVKSQSASRAAGTADPADKMTSNMEKNAKSLDELKTAVEQLKTSIDTGGAVGDALGKLASALTTGSSTVSQAFIGGADGSW